MGAIIAIVIFVIIVLIAMALSATVVGLSGVLFFNEGFVDGWHAAWNRPGWLLVFGVVAAWLLTLMHDN